MYIFSRLEIEINNGESIQDCNICFVLINLAIFSPLIIQYSTRINMLYHKGMYRKDKFDNLSIKNRIILVLDLTFMSIFMIFGLEIILVLQSLIKVALLPFRICQ